MEENTVKNHIKRWLESSWMRKAQVTYGGGQNVDLLVNEIRFLPWFDRPWIIDYEQVECKGTDSNIHRAIGQCLDYYLAYRKIPTYLAVPQDYEQLGTLERIIGFFNLPIGILLVDNDGLISKRREAKGKTRCLATFPGQAGNLITKPS